MLDHNLSMKVLDLQCPQRHSFEGWFASEDDFQSQLARGLVECPMCCNKVIQKMPSVPRLNLGGYKATGAGAHDRTDPSARPASASEQALQQPSAVDAPASLSIAPSHNSPTQQAAFFTALRQVLAAAEDVGDKFAHEARAMHYGDTEARCIRGQTSAREALELLQEGIDVMPLPPALKETLQ